MKNDNKLIADFMGMKYSEKRSFNDGEWTHSIQSLSRFRSWEWLMPVVEEIELLGYTFEKNLQRIDKDWQCLIVKGNDILYQEFNTDSRKAAYSVVVKFIKNQKNN